MYPQNSYFADREELINDAKYYIYKAAIEFDSNKKSKFSTFLGNQTRWMCLNLYNKSKRRPENRGGDEQFNKIEFLP